MIFLMFLWLHTLMIFWFTHSYYLNIENMYEWYWNNYGKLTCNATLKNASFMQLKSYIVRGESPYHDTELLYRRHPSVRPHSSIRPRPRSRHVLASHVPAVPQTTRSGTFEVGVGHAASMARLHALPYFQLYIELRCRSSQHSYIHIHIKIHIEIHSFRSLFLFFPS